VLTSSTLSYFESRSDTVAKGRIVLRDATLAKVKGELCVGIHFEKRVYVLQCKDKPSKAKWVEAIQVAIEAAKQK
jgi:hypothetical protein